MSLSANANGSLPEVLVQDVSPAARPYFSDEYWGGEVLADSDEALPVPEEAKLSSIKPALKALEAVLALERAVRHMRTFEPGDKLDPQRYARGRVFVLNQELLLPAAAGEPHVDMTAFGKLELPERPTDLDPPLGDQEHPYGRPRYTIGAGLIHENQLLYGVVTQRRKSDHKRLITFYSASVRRQTLASERLLQVETEIARPRVQPTPLVIGQTYHLRDKKDRPQLLRINAAAMLNPRRPRHLSTA